MAGYVTRYTLAAVKESGLRTLAFAAQGRNTWATPDGAKERLEAIRASNKPAEIFDFFGADLAVVKVKCYAGHFDPVGIYFEESDIVSR